jgi:acylpyruvate hydrolase
MRLVTFERRGAGSRKPTRRGELRETYRGLADLDEGPAGGRRIGALIPTDATQPFDLLDLHRALTIQLAIEDVGAPEAEADSMLPAAALSFLDHFASALATARSVESFVHRLLERFAAAELAALGVLESTRRARLRAPIPRPGKIIGVARNYPAHAEEVGAKPPEEPVLFLKSPGAVIGPDDPILLPTLSKNVDYEGELAVVIGRRARSVRQSDALEYVAGYTVANDVSARDWQGVRGQHFIGKSFDSFAPLGPALVTRDEIPDPQDLGLTTRIGDEVVQAARTKEMLFPVNELIAFASRILTLEPGDVVLTGTPAGVGKARTPPRFLRDGDLVEVEIERIGILRNRVRPA